MTQKLKSRILEKLPRSLNRTLDGICMAGSPPWGLGLNVRRFAQTKETPKNASLHPVVGHGSQVVALKHWSSLTSKSAGETRVLKPGIIFVENFAKRGHDTGVWIWANVKVMAHPLAGANVDRGVEVKIRCGHR
jgi:hypothetical protein